MQDRFSLSIASTTLKNGGVIAYPTEAIYGLGCDPNNEDALRRLIELKRRSAERGFILIGDSFERVAPYFEPPCQNVLEKIQATWPGPTTWLLRARNVHPLITGGRATVAIRVTSHPLCLRLCQTFGDALISTSANVSGKSPAKTPLQVIKMFGDQLDGVLHGPLGDTQQPSTIIDATTGTIVRMG